MIQRAVIGPIAQGHRHTSVVGPPASALHGDGVVHGTENSGMAELPLDPCVDLCIAARLPILGHGEPVRPLQRHVRTVQRHHSLYSIFSGSTADIKEWMRQPNDFRALEFSSLHRSTVRRDMAIRSLLSILSLAAALQGASGT